MFDKTKFQDDSEYLFYNYHGERLFVGRFKRGNVITKAQFKRELIKSHIPSQYFAALKNGSSPLDVLKKANKKWYIDTMNKYYLKRIGRKVYNDDGSHVEPPKPTTSKFVEIA